jgi:hypothetical protein
MISFLGWQQEGKDYRVPELSVLKDMHITDSAHAEHMHSRAEYRQSTRRAQAEHMQSTCRG